MFYSKIRYHFLSHTKFFITFSIYILNIGMPSFIRVLILEFPFLYFPVNFLIIIKHYFNPLSRVTTFS